MIFDIETLVPLNNRFPKAEHEPIITIGIILQSIVKDEEIKIILQLNTCDPVDNCNVIIFEDELEMINEFEDIVQN